MAKESAEAALQRWRLHRAVQEHYSEFTPFLEEVMDLLGFKTSPIQIDIGKWIVYGPDDLMVQAQRGQAKTTIAAAAAVHHLIMNPEGKVLIVSAGGSQASDISTLIVRIINTMPELEHMRPDTQNGDRSSTEHYDIHYSLKGVDKSPSVKCLGITANLQGNRATLLLADDIESQKNSMTQTQRVQLWAKTLDFASIVIKGRIVWLGTPQSRESIYNLLPGHGTAIRIWPGRYPSVEGEAVYGSNLAPMLLRAMAADPSLRTGGGVDGTQGQPTETTPGYLDEEALQSKERRQGPSWFQLQHMLNTRLADAARFPLKTQMMGMLSGLAKVGPPVVYRGMDSKHFYDRAVAGVQHYLANVQVPHEAMQEWDATVFYIDPAGGGANGDETGMACVSALNGNLFWRVTGGVPGGFAPDDLAELARRVAKVNPNILVIEKNFGYGSFKEVFLPILRKVWDGTVEEDYVTGRKESRIISTLEPVMAAGSLFISEEVLEQDESDCSRYLPQHRQNYSTLNQMAKLTAEAGSLVHDDRLDALEGAVRKLQMHTAKDMEQVKRDRDEAERLAWMKNPLGKPDYGFSAGVTSIFDKYKR